MQLAASTDLRSLISSRRSRSVSTANGCFKEAAELAATLEQYPRAVKHFENVATASLSSALTKYSVKDYYLKAGMCWLATGVSRRALARYLIVSLLCMRRLIFV